MTRWVASWRKQSCGEGPVHRRISTAFLNWMIFIHMEEISAPLDWVRNPFLLSEAKQSKLPVTYQEKLLKVSSDRGLKMKFDMFTLTQCVSEAGAPWPSAESFGAAYPLPPHIYVRPPSLQWLWWKQSRETDCAWRRAWSQQLPPCHQEWKRSSVKHKPKCLSKMSH